MGGTYFQIFFLLKKISFLIKISQQIQSCQNSIPTYFLSTSIAIQNSKFGTK